MRLFCAGDQGGVQRGDYFVPWHIPLHRVEAAAAAARTLAARPAEGPGRQTTSGGLKEVGETDDLQDESGPSNAGSSTAASAPSQTVVGSAWNSGEGGFADGRVDRAKRTVVFKRFYHLFDEGELDSLIQQVPGVCITDSFYDKSNWCVIYQRIP